MNNEFIPLSVPNLKGKELEYVSEAIKAEWVSTGGGYVNKFETDLSNYVNVKNAVSCQSGTAGLHTALMVIGVTSEDIVIVPTLTFIAAVNPVKYIGAEPVFMDCNDSLCIDENKIQDFIDEECVFDSNRLIHIKSGKHVKAMVVVHVFGNMANMEGIMDLSKKYNIRIVEDATEALGTYYTQGPYIGRYAGTIGDIGVYSFNGNKIITTGGGGMIVSNNEDYLNLAKHLTTQAKTDEQNYEHDMIGYNYRMTNIQAAMGVGQLEQLENFIKIKESNYSIYAKEISEIKGIELLSFRKETRSNKWFYGINCDKIKLGKNELIAVFKKNKIQTRPIWGLISEQVPYKDCITYKIEKAKYYWNNVINIPCSTNLLKDDVFRVIDVLKNI